MILTVRYKKFILFSVCVSKCRLDVFINSVWIFDYKLCCILYIYTIEISIEWKYHNKTLNLKLLKIVDQEN